MKKLYTLIVCLIISVIITSCTSMPTTSRDRELSLDGYSILESDFGGVERWYAVDKYNYDSVLLMK